MITPHRSGSTGSLRRALCICAFSIGSTVGAVPVGPNLMPVPAAMQSGTGRLPLTREFRAAFQGGQDARLTGALARALRALEERSCLTFARTPTGNYVVGSDVNSVALVIECASSGEAIPKLGEDESYEMDVSPAHALLRAPTALGVLRGLATFQQLLQSDQAGWYFPVVKIRDQPRFPWRGLMIDVCRHWQPMEVIKRNLDGMALVKLNVLHLHLTEDQGFRIESLKYPKLHELGSDGHYFTQDQIRELIAYAAARGIRVVPEFDIPGHATSWVTAYPELASATGPYAIERKWGVFNPVLDPTNEEVYRLLDGFLGEMAALFPDEYLHIGGDENNGVQWNANLGIQTFIREHQLRDNAGLHAWFNRRVHTILAQHGKKLIGWDEILHPELPAGSVVHSWRGPDGLAAATRQGFPAVLSNGYYIDLCRPGWEHYLNDPVPADTSLTPAQQKLVLGGEATMWSEWVTPENIDSRIWPRTAAIAERLWSPREVRDVPDMYRRLAVVSRRLEEAGLQHEAYLEPALRRLAGDQAIPADLAALRVFVDILEPVKNYQRANYQRDATQFTPLTGLVDCARPDSAAAREFAAAVDEFLTAARSPRAAEPVARILSDWHGCAEHLLTRLPALSSQLAGAQPLLQSLSDAAALGLKLCEGRVLSESATREAAEVIQRATIPHAAAELPIGQPLNRLLAGRP
jgi:hexosaminidase